MRLAFCLIKYFPHGGLQRSCLQIAEECLRRGHRVRMFTLAWDGAVPDGLEVVLKVYYGNRSPLLYLKKTFGNVVLTGRSSHMPKARYRVEMACLDTWEKHGFRCFRRWCWPAFPSPSSAPTSRSGPGSGRWHPGRRS